MAACTCCEMKEKRIGLLKDQLRREQESADRWRRDYLMLLRSTLDVADDNERCHRAVSHDTGEGNGLEV